MKSAFELELHTAWLRDALLQEAAAERLARQARDDPRSGRSREASPRLRFRLAHALYALADRLSSEAAVDGRLKTA